MHTEQDEIKAKIETYNNEITLLTREIKKS